VTKPNEAANLSWEDLNINIRLMVKNTSKIPMIFLTASDSIVAFVSFLGSRPRVITHWSEVPDWLKKLVNDWTEKPLYDLSGENEILQILSGPHFMQHRHLMFRVIPALSMPSSLPVSADDQPNCRLFVYKDCLSPDHSNYWLPAEYHQSILGNQRLDTIRGKRLYVIHDKNPEDLILFKQFPRRLPTTEVRVLLPELYRLWKLMTALVSKENGDD